MSGENQIIETETVTTPVVLMKENMLSDGFVDQAAKQIELRQKLMMTALKALKPHDIQDFDGKPYIEGEGAARIMSVVRGFKVGEPKFDIERIGDHYFVDCNIPMEFMGAATVALGDCSTADVFFCGRDGNSGRYGKYKQQTASESIAARLLLGDAKKKARENALSRGVAELLGLKGLSWEDLSALGFGQDKAGSSVSFKKGSQGGDVKTVTLAEAAKAAIGSTVSFKATLVKSEDRQVGENKKDKCGYTVTDGTATIVVQKWGKSGGYFEGTEIFCEKVAISEYNGNRQYMAADVRAVEAEG